MTVPKERKPSKLVVTAELEDNCGAVLVKGKLRIPVEAGGEMTFAEVDAAFRKFLGERFPAKFEVR
jgi:hypothetical protein